MLSIFGRVRYGAIPMFLLYHCFNAAVLLTAAVLYLHPFDAPRPSMFWILLSLVVAYLSLVMVVGQTLLFSERRGGGIGPWRASSQVLSIFCSDVGGVRLLGL